MARVVGKFLKGVVGDAVLRELNGVQILQATPRKNPGSRTEGTKKAASLFGVASNMAYGFRTAFTKLIAGFYDSTMNYRLNAEVMHCLNLAKNADDDGFTYTADSFSRLDGFEFNVKSPLKNQLMAWPQLIVDGQLLRVELPELNIPRDLKFPKGADSCQFILGCAVYDLQNREYKRTFVSLSIPNQEATIAPQHWEFEGNAAALAIIAVSLQFVKSGLAGDAVLNSKNFGPAAIIQAQISLL